MHELIVSLIFNGLKMRGMKKRSILHLVLFFVIPGDGRKLADVGFDDDHSICIWDWKREEKLASTRGHKDMIFVVEWNPFNPNYFVSVGEKHIKFWAQKGWYFVLDNRHTKLELPKNMML